MERQRRRNRLRAYGRADQIRPATVPAAPVREHLAALQAEGYGLERIADAAQVSRSVVMHVMYGPRGERGGKRPASIKTRPGERLLATTGAMIDAAFVPATGTARRLRALVAIGYSETHLASRIGMHRGNMSPIITGSRPRVTGETFAAVRALFAELWSAPVEGREAVRARNVAKRNRWVGPLAWDDIDDPDERPNITGEVIGEAQIDDLAVMLALSGEQVRLTPAERREAVARAHEMRWSDIRTADMTGMSERTVLRIRQELGLEAFEYSDLVQAGAA